MKDFRPLLFAAFSVGGSWDDGVKHDQKDSWEAEPPVLACSYDEEKRLFNEPNAWACFALCLPAEPKIEGVTTNLYKTVLKPSYGAFEFLLKPYQDALALEKGDPLKAAPRMVQSLRDEIIETSAKVDKLNAEIKNLETQLKEKSETFKALEAKALTQASPGNKGGLSDKDHEERSKALASGHIKNEINSLKLKLAPLQKKLDDFHDLFKRLDPNLRNTATAYDAALALKIEVDSDSHLKVGDTSFSITATSDGTMAEKIEIHTPGVKNSSLACDVAGTHLISTRETKNAQPCRPSEVFAALVAPDRLVNLSKSDRALRVIRPLNAAKFYQKEDFSADASAEAKRTVPHDIATKRIEQYEERLIAEYNASIEKGIIPFKVQNQLGPKKGSYSKKDIEDAVAFVAEAEAQKNSAGLEELMTSLVAEVADNPKGRSSPDIREAFLTQKNAEIEEYRKQKIVQTLAVEKNPGLVERVEERLVANPDENKFSIAELAALQSLNIEKGRSFEKVFVFPDLYVAKNNERIKTLDVGVLMRQGDRNIHMYRDPTILRFIIKDDEVDPLRAWIKKSDAFNLQFDDETFPLKGERLKSFCSAIKEVRDQKEIEDEQDLADN